MPRRKVNRSTEEWKELIRKAEMVGRSHRNRKELAKLTRKACSGNLSAQYDAGYSHMDNEFVGGIFLGPMHPTYVKGIRWLRLAAHQEHPYAMYSLACSYLYPSSGIKSVNTKMGIYWLKRLEGIATELGYEQNDTIITKEDTSLLYYLKDGKKMLQNLNLSGCPQ